VLTEANYQKVINPSLSRPERLAAFNERFDWDSTLGIGYQQQLLTMVNAFDGQGIVLEKPGVADDPDFPPQMQVSDRGGVAMTAEERLETDRELRRVTRLGTPKPEVPPGR
jgi:hypothetical protein